MSDQLVPSAGASFQQSGQVDWVSLSRSVVQISVGTLARLSRAGVDAYTVQVGKALCWNLELSAKVQDNLVEEIKNLKYAKFCDNLLWFGFGIKQVVEDLAETEQGLALVALCSALTTNYDVFYAAQVLRQLCLQAKAPQQFMPSLQQWKALLRLCSGILMDSAFERLLNGLHRHLRGSKPISNSQAIEPASIAKGLSDLALLSKGSIVRLSFIGGEDCCWLAAFAKWALSLDVAIYDATDSLIYLSQDRMSETPQVIFNLDVKTSDTVLSSQKTSLVPRSQSLIKLEARDHSASSLRFASTWATILRDTFGSVIDILLAGPCSDDFAVFLCDRPAFDWLIHFASRSESNVRENAIGNEPPSPPDRGRMENLMHSARNLLPELSLLQSEACWEKRKRYRALNKSLTNIEDCCCVNDRNTATERRLRRSAPLWRYCKADPCLVGLSHTICAYLRVLLMLNVGDGVVPSRRGLRSLYEQWYQGRKESYHGVSVPEVYEALTGDSTQNRAVELIAWAGNGLCIFGCFLEDPMGPLHETQRIAAVRGYIAYEDGWYESLSDMPIDPRNGRNGQDDQFRSVTKTQAIKAQPVVEETDDERSLGLGYKTRCSQLHTKKQSYWLKLGDLMSRLRMAAHSRRPCPEQHERRFCVSQDVQYILELELSRWAHKEGFCFTRYKDAFTGKKVRELSFYFGEGPALGYSAYFHDGYLFRDSLFRCPECLDCLFDWSVFLGRATSSELDVKGEAHFYGLEETPITVQWEWPTPQSPSPPPASEPASPKPSDGSNDQCEDVIPDFSRLSAIAPSPT